MHTELTGELRDRPDARRAGDVIRRCVHCGFCNATCPTYQVLGNELDGPRGRIYLMKRALEGAPVTRQTQRHLDRCLGCRACETTCPSGVRYHELLDTGRAFVDARVRRPLPERLRQAVLRAVLGSRRLFAAAVGAARLIRPLLPAALRRSLPEPTPTGAWPEPRHDRHMIALDGCVQPVVSPGIDRAAARLLDAAGVSLHRSGRGCCGAMRFHLGDQPGGLALARQRILDWQRSLDEGAEAIVITATGCAAFVRDYPRLFADDASLTGAAARVAARAMDIGSVLAEVGLPALDPPDGENTVALHCPCTLRHGLGEAGVVEGLLREAGVALTPARDTIACCGSAGAYSLLRPSIAGRIRQRKLDDLLAGDPTEIVTANVGCLHHLAGATERPVRHWVELLAERLPA